MKRARTPKPVSLRSRLTYILAGMLFVVGPTTGHAALILVDFGAVAPAPSFGGTWNIIPNPSGTTQLVDSTGAATNIKLSFSSDWFVDLQVSPWSFGNTAWIDGNAAMDGLDHAFTAPPGTINITGLATNLLYRIDLLAVQEFFGSPTESTADFSIFGSFGDSVPNGDNFDVHFDGLLGGNFMTWNTVTPNASGEILIQFEGLNLPPNDPGTQMLGDMASALRITCLERSVAGALLEASCGNVPEPGTMALMGLGIAGIFALRRRGGRAA